ncbi:viperin family antiviral radical SAM protein [Candidatus Uabimicrobium amorphum]|uniref:S-adenosylmethionine-dependent nucleotide dehydratase n=1 Tax=Uabimicrobium amorphum TaxID=2596890 RepID=A0A5S9F266_UABAM|nr:viperin family antiviral radical SAM protein [Candidatus Uabimicrobium amorphum]BBM83345.1 radical SAM protein [Candidatus Uabimicrobium amorphum]
MLRITTVNFHLIQYCNLRCKFCFARFHDVKKKHPLSLSEMKELMFMLKNSGCVKVNFAGGEPFIYPNLGDLVRYSYEIGLKTSIVTNGNFLTDEWLQNYGSFLHWIAVSCDSSVEATQERLGRGKGDQVKKVQTTFQLIQQFNRENRHKIRKKLNSVITRYNYEEDMSSFVESCGVERWKVLQVLPIDGENNDYYPELAITDKEFEYFQQRHKNLKNVEVVFEDNDHMTNSYIMMNPQGLFYQNHSGKYVYSEPVLKIGVEKALEQVGFSHEKFCQRGGFYQY